MTRFGRFGVGVLLATVGTVIGAALAIVFDENAVGAGLVIGWMVSIGVMGMHTAITRNE